MKAQIADLTYIIIVGATSIILGLIIWTALWGNFQSQPLVQNTLFSNTINPIGAQAAVQSNLAISIIDNFSIFAFLMAAVAAIILAVFTESHPAFAIVGIIVFPFEIILSYIFHDVFFAIVENSVFAPTAANLPYVILFFENYPIITGAIFLILIVVTFSK